MRSTGKLAARMAVITMAIATLANVGQAQRSDARAIRALSDQWQRDIAAQNVEAIAAIQAPDAVLMMSHSPLVTGSTAVRAAWAEMVKTPGLVLHWTPTKIEVASPAVATEYGTYTESYDTPQGKATDAGNYVTIWHKINGKWRVVVDGANTSVPMPAAAPAAPPEASTLSIHPASALTWGDLTAPGVPPGGKIAVLSGNPGGPGEFVLRLQFPDGFQVPVHWHPKAEQVTIVSGSLGFGMGNTFDASALRTYSPGDFAYIPANHAHFALAHGPTVVQVNGMGPFLINIGAPK
ncbi:MAG: SgcJ/EcaC family oxidoreductase [Gemmatimonadota bacterium]|nr:SgcJ/EcaC family oxidoreductase [Gemmatimonadota bacterium]